MRVAARRKSRRILRRGSHCYVLFVARCTALRAGWGRHSTRGLNARELTADSMKGHHKARLAQIGSFMRRCMCATELRHEAVALGAVAIETGALFTTLRWR
eukprot:5566684-Prymnesium_polylepis.2